MDQSQFQATARELLERHMAGANQPNRENLDVARGPEEPARPEDHQGVRYAQGMGDYVSETTAARQNDRLINQEFHAHERKVQTAHEQHIKKSSEMSGPGEPTEQTLSAREALMQHMEGAKREVTEPQKDLLDRNRLRQQQEYER